MNNPASNPLDHIKMRLESLNNTEFMAFGLDGLSYIKPINNTDDLGSSYALYSANGRQIAVGHDVNVLKATALQQALIPMVVH
jgi:hypothetical protein